MEGSENLSYFQLYFCQFDKIPAQVLMSETQNISNIQGNFIWI